MNAERLSDLFEADVAVSIATKDMYNSPLFAEEYSAIGRSRPIRRREFTAGRAASRDALAKLGVPPMPIPSGANRLPEWPSGYIGSISHCSDLCCSVVGRALQARSLGVDVESASPLPADLYRLVFDEDEMAQLGSVQARVEFDLFKVGFSAKEAFYKCHYPMLQTFLDFRDVSIKIERAESLSEGKFYAVIKNKTSTAPEIDHEIIGRWCVDKQHVFCGATLPT